MANIRVRERQKSLGGSPRATEVGEIDTRAPFQSVKAAVSLFGEVALSNNKCSIRKSKLSSENLLDKQTQLLLAQKELNKYKQQLEIAETTKARATSELERAKRTVEELKAKLSTVNQSKQSAIADAESVKNQAKKLLFTKSRNTALRSGTWKQELDLARTEYSTAVTHLDAAKQELTRIRQDFDAALELKLAAFQQAAEARRSIKVNADRADQLSKEIAAMQESIGQLKAREAQAKMIAEKETFVENYYENAKDEAEKKLVSLRKEIEIEIDPEITKSLESKLKETTAEIEILQEEMRKAHAAEMESVRAVTEELNEATKKLQVAAEEESTLRTTVNSLRVELENVKKEHDEFVNTQISEAQKAKREAEELKKQAEELKREAEALRIKAEEAERELKVATEEEEEAKAAEKKALDEMKILSERNETGGSAERIKLSIKEFECLSRKVEECDNMAENEEANATVEIEGINKRKNEAEKKLDANMKAIEEIKIATEIALKNAEMAESAKKVVEGELRRWRQEEQKVAAAAAAASATSGHIYF